MKLKKITALCLLAALLAGLCACWDIKPRQEPTTAPTETQDSMTATTQDETRPETRPVVATTMEWDWDEREIPIDKTKIVTKDVADYPGFLETMAADWLAEKNKPIAQSFIAQKQESYLDVFYQVYYAAFPDFRDEISGPGAQAIKAYYAQQYRKAQGSKVPNPFYDCDVVHNVDWEAFLYSIQVYAVEFTDLYLSVNFFTDWYSGGVHPVEGKHADVFDLKTGKKLALDDIVQVSSSYAIINTLAEKYLQENDIEPFEPFDIRESAPSSFRMTKEGPVLIYEPYAIASYADGIIEIPIPFSALGG